MSRTAGDYKRVHIKWDKITPSLSVAYKQAHTIAEHLLKLKPLLKEKGVWAEQEFEFDFDGIPVTGRMDIAVLLGTKKCVVGEIKTGHDPYYSAMLQLGAASLYHKDEYGITPKKLTGFFCYRGDPVAKEVVVPTDEAELATKGVLNIASECIRSKSSPARLSRILCPRCDYRDSCTVYPLMEK